jgi:hypothetical protein
MDEHILPQPSAGLLDIRLAVAIQATASLNYWLGERSDRLMNFAEPSQVERLSPLTI